MQAVQIAEPQPQTFDEMLTSLSRLNADIKRLTKEESELKEQKSKLEFAICQAMREQGITKAGNDVCNVSVKNEVFYRCDPDHWEDFIAWVFKTENAQVFTRKLNNNAIKELVDHLKTEYSVNKTGDETVPFVLKSDVEKLSYRSL